MGQVQRVFYFHVASAWVGMLGFFVSFIAGTLVLTRGNGNLRVLNILTLASIIIPSVIYIVTFNQLAIMIPGLVVFYLLGLNVGVRMKRDTLYWDIVGLAAIEISLVFFFIAIVMGAIWAKPVWGEWWTWDPRLTTASIVELVYAAYIMLRQGIEDPDRRARFGAVYAILGFISVPLTFVSIRIFRTIHPVVIGNSDPTAKGSFDMSPKMLQTFLFSLFVFSFVFADLLWHRIRLGRLADKVEELRLKVTQ